MSGKHIDFYIADEDLSSLIMHFKKVGNVKYTEAKSKINKKLEVYRDPDFLYEVFQKSSDKKLFNISYDKAALDVDLVKLNDGSGFVSSVLQPFNPETIEILLRGRVDDRVIEACTLRTTAESADAKKLYNSYYKEIKKASKKVGDSYLFEHAYEKLKSGWRLTPSRSYPGETDLAFPGNS